MISWPGHLRVITVVALICSILAFIACSNASANPTELSKTPDNRPQSTVDASSAHIYLTAPIGVYQSGWADLRNTPDGLSVEVNVTPAEPVAQPAHIHMGSCDQLGDIVYTLENIIGGRSSTVVPGVTVADVATGGMSINLHRSFSDFATFTACGEIPTLQP